MWHLVATGIAVLLVAGCVGYWGRRWLGRWLHLIWLPFAAVTAYTVWRMETATGVSGGLTELAFLVFVLGPVALGLIIGALMGHRRAAKR
jgi:hypothetical protein